MTFFLKNIFILSIYLHACLCVGVCMWVGDQSLSDGQLLAVWPVHREWNLSLLMDS